MKQENKITIFTPTFNRAYILPHLYDSLCEQTNPNFMWFVIDDGSTDNTKELIDGWIHDNIIDIKYIKETNSGKMHAHNVGVELTETEYFVCLDSDDYLAKNAVEIIYKYIEKIKDDSSTIGLFFPKKVINHYNEMVLHEPFFTTYANLFVQGFRGEITMVFKTEILKKYPFQLFENEKFVTEAISYDRIDQKYKYLYVPEAFTICKYMNDGYTKNLMNIYNNYPCGYVQHFKQRASLFNDRKYLSIAYKFTFLIKDKEIRKKYQKDSEYQIDNKIFGFLMYIKFRIVYSYLKAINK